MLTQCLELVSAQEMSAVVTVFGAIIIVIREFHILESNISPHISVLSIERKTQISVKGQYSTLTSFSTSPLFSVPFLVPSRHC